LLIELVECVKNTFGTRKMAINKEQRRFTMNKIFPRRMTHFILAAVLAITLGGVGPVLAQTPGAGERTYVVQPGDTLSGIAVMFGTTTADLMQRNPQLFNPNLIFSGQTLIVPTTPVVPPAPPAPAPPPVGVIPDTGPGERIYVVRAGDTLSTIAFNFGTTTADLVQRNPHIVNPNLIFTGQRLAVPTTPVVMPPPGIPVTGPPDEPIHPETARQVVFDDFTRFGLWFTGAEPEWQIQYVGNQYRILNNFFSSHVSSVRTVNHPNVHAAIDAQQVGGPASGFWGVVCRWQDINNFYAAVISGDGTTGILRVQNGFHNWLNQGTAEFNANAWNRVGATCDGNTIILYLNGEEVLETTDTVFTTGSFAGVMVGTRGAAGADVHFDNFTAYIR
jgi:LysM repeat protein